MPGRGGSELTGIARLGPGADGGWGAMSRDFVGAVAGCGTLLLVLGAFVAAGVRWDLDRLPNWVLCLLVGAGFALVAVVAGVIASSGDWGSTLAAAGIVGGIFLVAAALAGPSYGRGRR